LQLALNGAMEGAILAVPAIGFNAVYAILRFTNFAVASIATIGAYAGWMANTTLGWPVTPSLLAAFMIAGAVGVLADEIVLRPLRPTSALTTAIASVALAIILENAIRFFFGNDPRGFNLPVHRDWRGFGLHVGPQQAQDAGAAIIAMAALFGFLAFTRAGKTMRAVADNPILASLKGIDAVRIGRIASFVGLGLCGFGGMLIALDTQVDPLTGFRVLLSIFAAAVVGGLGSIPGAVMGAFLVGIGQEMSLLFLPAAYRGAVGFLAILLMLTLRPAGILGQRTT
jgi:branched-subunit amino acid ABC-type transport system permease component